uniref:Uncharacterized protein n=1 Tax=Nelumbo nucifera TaxID=4432 RepID=A0A822ZBH3_NELNU|nr:TPA_asm: hypothetical protein HUJ06_014719 [Nelumbo nucifera]
MVGGGFSKSNNKAGKIPWGSWSLHPNRTFINLSLSLGWAGLCSYDKVL